MSKRKLTLIVSIMTTVAILVVVILLNLPRDVSLGEPNPPQDNPEPKPPEGTLLTVPENIFGTLGIVSAIAIAFLTYALSKKITTLKIP